MLFKNFKLKIKIFISSGKPSPRLNIFPILLYLGVGVFKMSHPGMEDNHLAY